MLASFPSPHKGRHGLASTLFCGIVAIGLGFAAPAARAAGGDEGGGTGANPGGGASGGAGVEKKPNHAVNKTDLTTCAPGQVWDTKKRKCLERHSGVLPDSDLTEYAYRACQGAALSGGDRRTRYARESEYPRAPSTTEAMRRASSGGRTKGSATICNPSLSTLSIRRCANILARPMSFRASSTWRRINCR